jgi:membrane protein
LTGRGWWGVLKRTVTQFQADQLTDWAAALTYYGIMSLFPALLVAVSALGLFGRRTMDEVINNVTTLTPGTAQSVVKAAVGQLQQARGTAGVLAIVGLAGALWSASAYISAFIRAANAIYDVPEGRPIWKTLPLRIGLTVLTGALLGVSVLAIVFTGRFAQRVGDAFGIGRTAVTVWDYAKWPVLVIAISLMFAVLYYLAPNARHTGFRWITPGSVLAVVIWLVASGGFALYVANFNSYNKTYGTFGGVIAFLVWLWISNVAVLLGAEFDAELERGRAIQGGMPAGEEPYLPLRDDHGVDDSGADDLDGRNAGATPEKQGLG